MNAFAGSIARWLADYYLLATLLLAASLAVTWCVAQPARRVAVTRAALAGLALLAVLCAVPGWSVVHLMTREASPPPAAIVAPAIENESLAVETTPIEAPVEAMPLAQMPATASPPAAVHVPITTRLSDLVAWAFLFGSLAVVAWQVLGNWRARVLVRQARIAPPELQRMLLELSGAARVAGVE
ncbi:MAG: hypothetical protein WD851_05155, partial [Pirellulales bacterium]